MSRAVAAFHPAVRAAWATALAVPACEDATALLAADPAQCLLVAYRAPWESVLALDNGATDPLALLTGWIDFHRAILRLADAHISLVNAGRATVGSADLARELEAAGFAPAGALPEPVAGSAMTVVAAWMLGRLLEELAPEAWEIYENLEARALLGGREPEYRANQAPGAAGTLEALLGLGASALGATGQQAAAREAALAACAREAALVQAAVAQAAASETERAAGRLAEVELRAELDRAGALLAEIRVENELLALQLAQTQVELSHQLASGEQLRGELERSAASAERARLVLARLVSGQGAGDQQR